MADYPTRGSIYIVDLDPTIGSEMSKKRPALIISKVFLNG
jgi:mRNA-degrading endonuclease toxin of MazEF toxin-antitoxin module